ncbi:SIMPL domain-containing protein [Pseudoalteromonas sp. SG45-5]|uniref:SIMPL domain-containing protein n=1 Tax=unclassified Pseudoalteromonas TaxID=194690 RepID=UPI0015F987B1|nr:MULTISPECIES: SIMPL domain-containing protein [unclassified Pseudoalteromonas]MBB1385365.1 SIMPL domain-containing protein [Pseudoalteromonas sp. SG45-5]MBB1393291.1 SIMPL domain-containing protein [Pseudoalteromonas sp. SG44-4]MBB1446582.1 SIMPL domain-containing protein [Pseudoalteromonas sp. SG41-6]
MKLIITIFLTLFPLITFGNSSLPANRHIAVQGTAEVLAVPDMANISFEVISTKDTLLEAKRDVDKRVNLLTKGADRYGIAQGDIFISGLTSHVNNMIGIEKGTISGDKYLARKRIKVTLKDIERTDDFIEFAQSVKINNVMEIESLSSKGSKLEAKATQAAIDNAKAKGSMLAKAFGAELGKVYSINSTANHQRYPTNNVKSFIFSGSGANSNPFEQVRYVDETIIFTSSISVVFDLEIK